MGNVVKSRAMELVMRLRSKQGMQIRKEDRATKLVAIVMGIFFELLKVTDVYHFRNSNLIESLSSGPID